MNRIALVQVWKAIERHRAFLLSKFDDSYYLASDAHLNKLYYEAEALIKGEKIIVVVKKETRLFLDFNNRVQSIDIFG